jgi:putative oxidoreductase
VLQRIFSTFPSGWPGAGLLLLRAAAGIVFAAQGIAYLVGWHDLGAITWVVSLLDVAGGISLLVGYLTPFAGILVGVTCVGCALSWIQPPYPNLFDAKLAAALATTIAVGLACLGPGAFSIDAQLFGRREIIIPDVSSQPEP